MKGTVLVCGIAAMLCGTAAWADRPEQALFEPIQVTGEVVIDCDDFLVLYDGRLEGFERHYLNSDGSLNKILYETRWRDGVYCNSNDPSYWLPGISERNRQWWHFKDGVPTVATGTGAPIRVVAPGYGRVAFQLGVWKFDFALGDFVFEAGPRDLADGDIDALCAALRP
jgi:hypothetical protein